MTKQKDHETKNENGSNSPPESKSKGNGEPEWEIMDKQQENNIFQLMDNIKGCFTILLAIIFLFFCFSQCESTKDETKEQKTEFSKPEN